MGICGIDEAGRGPWAGPVVAAAVILPSMGRPKGLADSKQLTAETREELALAIRACAMVGFGAASPTEIDQLNILQATYLAMRRALEALPQRPAALLIDGNAAPDFGLPTETIVDGDAHVACISAASIIAKVERDRMMVELCARHPGYAFSKHKGYGTPEHQEALARLGPCAIHRLSFKPVRAALEARAA
ncbi:MAG TPA: ribonuclease HII [Hyphomonadaceae bacterium]|nr:ribonuclease HII [Hyphomonadaceae bacterium]